MQSRRFGDGDTRDAAHGRPMVVAYRFSALTAFLLRTLRMVKVHILATNFSWGRRLVPEFLQEEVSGAGAGSAC